MARNSLALGAILCLGLCGCFGSGSGAQVISDIRVAAKDIAATPGLPEGVESKALAISDGASALLETDYAGRDPMERAFDEGSFANEVAALRAKHAAIVLAGDVAVTGVGQIPVVGKVAAGALAIALGWFGLRRRKK